MAPLQNSATWIRTIRTKSTMSAKNESYNDYVQIVKDVIDIGLIDSVVAKLPSNTTGTTDPVATSLDWTPACDDFLQTYRTEVYLMVDPKRLRSVIDVLILRGSPLTGNLQVRQAACGEGTDVQDDVAYQRKR